MDDNNGPDGNGNIARLVSTRPGGSRGGEAADIGSLRDEFMALRQEIAWRDDLLRLVLARLPENALPLALPTPGTSGHRAGDRRNIGAAKYEQLRHLLSRLVDKLETRPGPEVWQGQLDDLRGDFKSADLLLDALREESEMAHRRIDTLETAVAALTTDGDNIELQNINRELAAFRDRQAGERAVLVEMRLDLDQVSAKTQANAIQTKTLVSRIEGLVADMADVKKRVVRFVVSRMKPRP